MRRRGHSASTRPAAPACCAGRLATRTRAHQLRGWSRGTPFIAINRDTWGRDEPARQLDMTLDDLVRQGHLRIANDRDLNEVRGEMVE